MSEDRENFEKWYVHALVPLRTNGDAGFIFALVAFPLPERYLRQKSGTGEAPTLNAQFFQELSLLFPKISTKPKDFWQCYRKGLLHQVTFSQAQMRHGIWVNMPASGISGHNPDPVYYDTGSNCFYLNPVSFFAKVVESIKADFSNYTGLNSSAHSLPHVTFPGTQTPGTTPTINTSFPFTGII